MKTGHTVLVVSVFAGSEGPPTKTVKYKTTYNRTDAANRVQDILSSLAHLRAQQPTGKVAIVGMGKAGLSAFLARAYAPALTAIAADVGGFANNSDDAFIKELPIPGIRRAGDFLTAALAETQSPLLVHGTATAFQTKEIMTVYREIGRSDTFKTMAGPASIDTLTTWLDRQTGL